MSENEKIELHAIYAKSGHLIVCDQHGREIDAASPNELRTDNRVERVHLDVTLCAPTFPEYAPRAEIRLSLPLEVEERLPEHLREILAPRPGLAIVGWLP